jgi:hypothetical protein
MPDFAQERRAVAAGHLNVAEDQIGQMLPSHFGTFRLRRESGPAATA